MWFNVDDQDSGRFYAFLWISGFIISISHMISADSPDHVSADDHEPVEKSVIIKINDEYVGLHGSPEGKGLAGMIKMSGEFTEIQRKHSVTACRNVFRTTARTDRNRRIQRIKSRYPGRSGRIARRSTLPNLDHIQLFTHIMYSGWPGGQFASLA